MAMKIIKRGDTVYVVKDDEKEEEDELSEGR